MTVDDFLNGLRCVKKYRFSHRYELARGTESIVYSVRHGQLTAGNSMVNKRTNLKDTSTHVVSSLPDSILAGQPLDCIQSMDYCGDQSTTPELLWVQDGERYLCNEYYSECLVNHLLGQLGHPNLLTATTSWIDEHRYGNLLLPTSESTLGNLLPILSASQLLSITLQVFCTLSHLEEYEFKHHDLHEDNVFIDLNTHPDFPFEGETVTYRVGNEHITFPHCGLWARIGDFGYASMKDPESGKRITRVDVDDMKETIEEIGLWSNKYSAGYDMETYLSFVRSDEIRPECKEIMDSLVQEFGGLQVCACNRPIRNSTVRPSQFILSSQVFKDFSYIQNFNYTN